MKKGVNHRQLLHHKIKTRHPKAVIKAKKLFHFRYLKLTILILMIVFAYLLFQNPNFISFVSELGKWNYIGIFVAGLLFSFGFTTPFAVAFFLASNPSNIFLAAIIGGIGAVISDFFIFKTIKLSMMDEF